MHIRKGIPVFVQFDAKGCAVCTNLFYLFEIRTFKDSFLI